MKTEKEIEAITTEKIAQLSADLADYKKLIGDDYRIDIDDDLPGMLITIATDNDLENWALQSGDNSYMGDCYGLPHWEVIYLYRDSDVEELANDAINSLIDNALTCATNEAQA